MKVRFTGFKFSSYRRASRNVEDLYNMIHHDNFYSLWFNLLPILEVNYNSYDAYMQRNKALYITIGWLFWKAEIGVETDLKPKEV